MKKEPDLNDEDEQVSEILGRYKDDSFLGKFRNAYRLLTGRGRQKKETTIHAKPFVELPDGILCEQAFDGQTVFYLVYDENEKVTTAQEVKHEGIIYRPIDNQEVRKELVLLPSSTSEFGDEEELMKDIMKFLNKWHEPLNEESRTLDMFYVLLTYIKDLIPQIPYRRILAEKGRGKSAWLESLGWISYRGLILAGSDTNKSIVRRIDIWKGTALIDEADFGDSTFYSFIIKILNLGYDKKTGYYQRMHACKHIIH